ncbi:major facilitator superfamily domain-containing protein [Xylaria arbuscula]|nr:major facilitator superfamily domain-containing protein [Xylaria arbuscula]
MIHSDANAKPVRHNSKSGGDRLWWLSGLSKCIYYFCNTIYFAFTAGCAFSTNTAMFLVFRLICGTATSGPMAIGEQRGKATALFAIGPLLGPVLGPIIGGFVTETVGWRWTFRIILIISGVINIFTFVFMPETSATALLHRKSEQMHKETETDELVSKLAPNESPKETLLRAIMRPIKMLIFIPIVLLISLYTGLLFSRIFLLFATFPTVFEGTYGFSAGTVGLAYLGLGLGFVTGLVIFSDGAPPQLEQRPILMKWFGPISPLGIFLYGWTAYYYVHCIVRILGTYIVGLGFFFGAQAAASALAENLLVRSPFGAFLDLAASLLCNKLGLGWGDSVLSVICLAFTSVPWLFYLYGESLRARFTIDP